MKRLILPVAILCVGFIYTSCGGGGSTEAPKEEKKVQMNMGSDPAPSAEAPSADVGDPMTNLGIGPVKSIELAAIDQGMVAEGKKLFEEYCTACHKVDKKFIGPSPAGIMERRTPEWVMNMILNPEEMIQKDPLAKQVMMESNMAVMANQNMTEDQARKILEYFRTL
ncbi:MAG: cytochrome c [Flavobacteriales bacterium]|nr:cytochrome c [Flavobacteriales bacterium]